jgi:hypothetical protein
MEVNLIAFEAEHGKLVPERRLGRFVLIAGVLETCKDSVSYEILVHCLRNLFHKKFANINLQKFKNDLNSSNIIFHETNKLVAEEYIPG